MGLFGLYIDELEEVIMEHNQPKEREGPTIGIYTLYLLLYADDVIIMAHTYEKMNALLELLKAFCLESGLSINVAKTKMMICSKSPKPTFIYK